MSSRSREEEHFLPHASNDCMWALLLTPPHPLRAEMIEILLREKLGAVDTQILPSLKPILTASSLGSAHTHYCPRTTLEADLQKSII